MFTLLLPRLRFHGPLLSLTSFVTYSAGPRPGRGGGAIPCWPAGVALALVVWSTVAPASLDPLYRAWMRFGLLLSRVTTPLILTLVFLLTIVPTALVMRALRRDPLDRRLDGNAKSYRVESDQTTEKSLDNPF